MPIVARRPPAPTPDYALVVAVILELPHLMATARADSGLSVKVQAKAVGVTAATLTRLGAGSVPTQSTIIACLRYLVSTS